MKILDFVGDIYDFFMGTGDVFNIRGVFQDMLVSVYDMGFFGVAKAFLRMNPSTGDFAAVWGVVTRLYENVCVPIGMGLVLIYFVVGLLEKSMQQQQLDVEQVVKALLKLIVGMFLIEHGLELMAEIYGLGLSFLGSIVGGTSEGVGSEAAETLAAETWKNITGEDFYSDVSWGLGDMMMMFSLLLQMGIPSLLTMATSLICLFVIFFRLVEFYITTCMAPIALSDFFTDGLHSNGWKFVKSYLALSLQMVIMMLAVVVTSSITAGFFSADGSGMLGGILSGEGATFLFSSSFSSASIVALGCNLACAAVLLKSRSIARELVGV